MNDITIPKLATLSPKQYRHMQYIQELFSSGALTFAEYHVAMYEFFQE